MTPGDVTRVPKTEGAAKRGVLGLLMLAAGLRLYRLDAQLWLDEISALVESIQRPVAQIVTEWPGVSSHVLYEILARLSSLALGWSPFSLRLPSAAFGVAGVGAIYLLARRFEGPRCGLFVGALMAVSYHHVFYSQNARGYTALIFLSLISFIFVLRFVDSSRISTRDGSIYAVVNALLAYVQPFGVFVPASNFLIALGLWFGWRAEGTKARFPLRSFTVATAVAAAITAVLYLPFVPGMMAHARTGVTSEAEGPKLGVGLASEVLEGLSAAFGGPLGLVIVAILGALGFALWAREHRLAALVLALPPLLEALVFAVAGFGLHPRYFAVALPVVFLVAGHLVFRLAGLAAGAIAKRRPETMATAALAVCVLVSAIPLVSYYRLPKQDFRGAYELIEAEAASGDARVGIQSAGTALGGYYDPAYVKIESVADLKTAEATGEATWVVMTLERLTERVQPDLYGQVLDRYELVRRFPGSVGDGDVTVYRRQSLP